MSSRSMRPDMTIASGGLVGGARAIVALDKNKETATLTFAAPLKPGKAKIELSYAGIINRQANGLFALDYKDVDGKDARSLFTQFEPADARRVFPSWDEPAFKATFDLNVTVPTAQMAVGNMPVATRKPAGNGRDLGHLPDLAEDVDLSGLPRGRRHGAHRRQDRPRPKSAS